MEDAELFSTFQTIIYIATGAIIWEYILAAPFEFAYFLGGRRWTPGFVIYFISRHFAMWNIILCQVLMHSKSPIISCKAVTALMVTTGAITVAASTLIFVARACAMWSWRKTICIPLLTMTFLSLAFAITTTLWVKTTYTEGVGCVLSEVGAGFAVSNAIAVSVDVLTLVALVVGTFTQQHGALRESNIANVLLKDGVFLVAALVIVNVGSISLTLTQEEPIAQFMLAAPMFLLSPLLAGRCHRGLIGSQSFFIRRRFKNEEIQADLKQSSIQLIHITTEQITSIS